jgi:amidase
MARCVRDAALLLDAMTSDANSCSGGPPPAAGASAEAAGPAPEAAGGAAGGYEAAAVEAAGGAAGGYEAAAVEGAAGRRWRRPRVAFSADLGGVTPMDPEVASICREAARWFSAPSGAGDEDGGGGGGGESRSTRDSGGDEAGGGDAGGPGLGDACPDMRHARRLFRVLRALACADLAATIQQLPGARDVVKPEVVWQVGWGHPTVGRVDGCGAWMWRRWRRSAGRKA